MSHASKNIGRLMKSAFETVLLSERKGFDSVLAKCKFIEGDIGRVVASLKVEEEHCNKGGTLHGGLSATLIDSVSTLALTSDQNFSYGVSVNMDISYIKAAKLGEEVLIEAKVLKRGKTLAFLDCELRNKAGDLLVKGSHTKFIQL